MPLDWDQYDRAPTRFEAEQEAAEERHISSYEERLRVWCLNRNLDTECLDSVFAYEDYFEAARQEWSN